jgi:hypothetical protein
VVAASGVLDFTEVREEMRELNEQEVRAAAMLSMVALGHARRCAAAWLVARPSLSEIEQLVWKLKGAEDSLASLSRGAISLAQFDAVIESFVAMHWKMFGPKE